MIQWMNRMCGRRPRGVNRAAWRAARRHARERYEGLTIEEPHVRHRIQALRGELARQYREDPELRPALAAVRTAERGVATAIELRTAAAAAERAAAENAAEDRPAREEDLARRTAVRRARYEREGADRAVSAARNSLAAANHALPAVEEAAVNRLVGTATRGLEPINAYIAALSIARRYEGFPALEGLPDDYAFELVQQAVRQITIERRQQDGNDDEA